MIGRIVSAETTTAPTRDRRRRGPSLPMNGMPITSRPAIASITIEAGGDDGRAGRSPPTCAAASRRLSPGRDLLAVAADDQQRVVDARAEAEHRSRSPTRTPAGRAARRARPAAIWPIATPSSAPTSVATIAASERNRIVSRMIAMTMPTSSPTGASCSEPRSTIMPRAENSTPFLLGLLAAGLDQRRPSSGFSISLGSIVVADVDGRRACRPARSCRPRRTGRRPRLERRAP